MRRHTRLLVETLESRRLLAAVTIPTNLTGAAGAQVSAPIRVDTASGVRAAEIRLSYDTDILNLDNASVQVGSVWSSNTDTQITANVDDAAGTIVIFVSSANPLSNIDGSLAVLNFSIISSATSGETATLNLTSVTLNEGSIAVSPAPAAGADSTDGLITVTAGSTGTGSISGFVFADANRNNTVDAGEAIGGVVITLTNSTTGATQQATTASDGSYRFANLAAGGFQLTEQQPAAFFEGGVNTLTVQLTGGSNLTNQNFVEGGLAPAAIFTRLRTTLVMPVGSAAWQSALTNIVQVVNSSGSSTSSTTASAAASSSELASLATQAFVADSGTASDSLVAEGEYVAPTIVTPTMAPLPDTDAKEKQRIAALEQALVEMVKE